MANRVSMRTLAPYHVRAISGSLSRSRHMSTNGAAAGDRKDNAEGRVYGLPQQIQSQVGDGFDVAIDGTRGGVKRLLVGFEDRGEGEGFSIDGGTTSRGCGPRWGWFIGHIVLLGSRHDGQERLLKAKRPPRRRRGAGPGQSRSRRRGRGERACHDVPHTPRPWRPAAPPGWAVGPRPSCHRARGRNPDVSGLQGAGKRPGTMIRPGGPQGPTDAPGHRWVGSGFRSLEAG